MRDCFILIFSKDSKYSANILLAGVEPIVNNYAFYLFQLDSHGLPINNIIDISRKCKKIVIGFTFMTPQLPIIKNAVGLLRSYLDNAIFVAGGPHASGDPLGTLTKLGFDVVVFGEGEETLAELLNAISCNNDFRVCGTAFIEDDRLVIRRRSRYVDLNLYAPFPYWRNRFNPIEIMRGCSSACYFCQVTYVFGRPRYRDVDNVAEYSKLMVSRGLKDIRFIAPNSLGYGSPDGIKPDFNAVLLLLQKLHRSIREYGGRIFFGTFPSELRPDSVSDDIIREMKRYVNNSRVIVGAQSGSNRILKIIHRKHSVEDVVVAVEILNRYGFTVDVDLIFGFPFEEEDDLTDTIKFIQEIGKFNVRFHIHIFIPLPGTPYSDLNTKFLDEKMRKTIAKLIGLGKAYGEWCEQEKIAKLIIELRNGGLIYGLRSISRISKVYVC
ncbi:MAG: TIGR04013 family B12-binding domain/radical SAM domain-containing protein [Ignisphaera sp.]